MKNKYSILASGDKVNTQCLITFVTVPKLETSMVSTYLSANHYPSGKMVKIFVFVIKIYEFKTKMKHVTRYYQ